MNKTITGLKDFGLNSELFKLYNLSLVDCAVISAKLTRSGYKILDKTITPVRGA